MKYAKAFEDSYYKLCCLIKMGFFNPNQKQDIIDKIELLHNEYIEKHYKGKSAIKIVPYKKIPDLDLYKIRKLKDFQKDTHCLFVRFEFITDVKDKKILLAEYRKFILKIYNEFTVRERKRLLIVDKTNTLTQNDLIFSDLKKELKRVKIFLC